MPRAARPLSAYQVKRDFSSTTEPSGIGDISVLPSTHLRFVVQKHDATRLHYDLRLECGGIFKSWAVTKGPSLDPAEKRLAVEVEDHPLDYGDFEGTIPQGEYGGGAVMIWDRGFWMPEIDEPIGRALRQGELKFALAGAKLRGSFVLVRMLRRKGEPRDNWLLIKHRDKWATPGKDMIADKDRSVASGRTMKQIAARKGAGASSFMTAARSIPAATVWHGAAGTSANTQNTPASSNSATLPRLTNPDRILWPGQRPLTKRHLAEYLLAVAPWMIDHIRGRPCSFLRAPNGIEGELFFQRHAMPGQPAALKGITVDKSHAPYVQIDDVQTLVGMAQFSVLEFHPWNSAPDQPGSPGRLVFDLDPAPDVSFDLVTAAAREIRTVLDGLGLVAFCKTSGGKGLHVVTPLTPDAASTWEQAKLFTATVATQLAARDPARYVTTMSKRQRSGRIFIDYLRNDATATAVAPLSPRARPGAPVSMPLTWRQVKAGLDASRFTTSTVPMLLAKSDAWVDYARSARPLRTAIDLLIQRSR